MTRTPLLVQKVLEFATAVRDANIPLSGEVLEAYVCMVRFAVDELHKKPLVEIPREDVPGEDKET